MFQHKALRYVLFSQLGLYGFLFLCTLLMPQFLFEHNEGGVSNYGVHALTVVPYSLAFGLGGVLLIVAAHYLPTSPKIQPRKLRRVLTAIGVLLLFALLTTYPYKVNRLFDLLHIFSAILLFVAELAVGVWLVLRYSKDSAGIALLAAQILGSLLSLLTLIDILHILFISQIIVGAAFGSLAIWSVSRALDTTENSK